MEILLDDKNCIIKILSPIIYKSETKRLLDSIREYSEYKVGIDIDNVIDCSMEFIEMLKNVKEINVFNIRSDIFAIFNKMGLDRCIKIYNSEIDFLADEHRLLNRNFTLIKSNKV